VTVAVGQAEAAIIPYGVQTNIPVDTVLNTWGWSVVYQDTYVTNNVPIGTVFSGVSPGDYVMLAAKPLNGTSFTLLAAGLESDVRMHTNHSATHTANGVNWYYNNGSMGFAQGDQSIYQWSADVMDAGWGYTDPVDPNGATRLSWHTIGSGNTYSTPPEYLYQGWRAGNTIDLNGSSSWERYVLVANAVPEPSTLLLWSGLGAIGAVIAYRRKRRAA
jgi:hypothetical protein